MLGIGLQPGWLGLVLFGAREKILGGLPAGTNHNRLTRFILAFERCGIVLDLLL